MGLISTCKLVKPDWRLIRGWSVLVEPEANQSCVVIKACQKDPAWDPLTEINVCKRLSTDKQLTWLDVRLYVDFAKLSFLKIRVVQWQGRWQDDDSRPDVGKLTS
eukprot:701006-Amphidinium_carterae.3